MSATLPSPRTPDEPMAFTRDEFWRGALAAWCAFMILLCVTLIVAGIQTSGLPWGPPLSMITLYLMFGVPIGGFVAAVVTVVVSPAAWALGRALRRTRRIVAHLLAYAAFGAAMGCTVVLLSVLLTSGDASYTLASPLAWLTPPLCALAVACGWAWTVRRSRRGARPDADAAYEDSALG